MLRRGGGFDAWRVSRSVAAYHDFYPDWLTEECALCVGHLPRSYGFASGVWCDHRNRDLILSAGGNALWKRQRGASHWVSADERPLESWIPVTAAGILYQPCFGKCLAWRHFCVIGYRYVIDEKQAIAGRGRAADRGHRCTVGAKWSECVEHDNSIRGYWCICWSIGWHRLRGLSQTRRECGDCHGLNISNADSWSRCSLISSASG